MTPVIKISFAAHKNGYVFWFYNPGIKRRSSQILMRTIKLGVKKRSRSLAYPTVRIPNYFQNVLQSSLPPCSLFNLSRIIRKNWRKRNKLKDYLYISIIFTGCFFFLWCLFFRGVISDFSVSGLSVSFSLCFIFAYTFSAFFVRSKGKISTSKGMSCDWSHIKGD